MKTTIHFHSSDDRFCGSAKIGRRFTLDENEVTCLDCKSNDRLILTEQGAELLKSLGYPTMLSGK
jgi:hypothetical protein